MEQDETSKLADVQTKPADLLVSDLPVGDEPAAVVKATEPAAVVKTTEPAAEPVESRTKADEPRTKAATKNPKRVEQGKRLAEWNKANKRRQLLEPTLKQLEATTPEPALKQLEASTPALKQLETKGKTKGNTKDFFLIGETILIIGLLSVGLFLLYLVCPLLIKLLQVAPKKLNLNQLSLKLKLKLKVPKKLSL